MIPLRTSSQNERCSGANKIRARAAIASRRAPPSLLNRSAPTTRATYVRQPVCRRSARIVALLARIASDLRVGLLRGQRGGQAALRRVFLELHLAQGAELVIASRYQPGALIRGVPTRRIWTSNVASWLFRLLFPIPGVKDYTCGYRAYRAELLQRAFERYGESFVDQEGFQCMVDILLKLHRLDPLVREVPMILRYDLKEGPSKMNVSKTIGATLRLMLQRRLEE